jgi:hypothetical protein
MIETGDVAAWPRQGQVGEGGESSDAGPSQRWEQGGDDAAGFSAPTDGNSAGTLGWRAAKP